jgi:hypothetical protein
LHLADVITKNREHIKQVLLYTIQNEPPSLSSYPDQKRGSVPFSRALKDLVRMCLQKDPSKRPTCAKLLTHALFAQRTPTPTALVNDLLDKIQDVHGPAAAGSPAQGGGGGGMGPGGLGGGGGGLGIGGGERAPGTEAVDVAQLIVSPAVTSALAAGPSRASSKAASASEDEAELPTERASGVGSGGEAPSRASNHKGGAPLAPVWSFDDDLLREAAAVAGIVLPSAAATPATATRRPSATIVVPELPSADPPMSPVAHAVAGEDVPTSPDPAVEVVEVESRLDQVIPTDPI